MFIVTNYGEEYQTLLTGPRLHFSGNFICDPATVNNDIKNFDITSFVSHHALPSSQGGRGLYSPSGTNSFLLKDVSVRSICYDNQTCTDDRKADLVVGKEIKDNARSMAKIVDIDPQDPVGVTQIWAMKLRIAGIVAADAGVLTMRDLWKRETSDKKDLDSMLTGKFHGVLKNIEFESKSLESVFANQLRHHVETSFTKELSIRFVLDMFRFNHTGRIYGTIGCHGYNSPESILFSRVLMSEDRSLASKASFAVDEANRALVFDFGSSFRTNENGTHVMNESENYLITYKRYTSKEKEPNFAEDNWREDHEIIGAVPLWSEVWLLERAGFVILKISESQLKEVKSSPLEVIKVKGEGTNAIYEKVILREEEDGVQIFSIGDIAYRKESGDTLDIKFIASKFGRPQPDIEVVLIHHCERDQKDVFCEPKLPLPMTVKTNKDGRASANIRLPTLRTPRKVMDGQVYKVVYFDKSKNSTERPIKDISQYSSIVLKVFDHVEYESETTWVDHVYPIFLQYANLFPVMKGSTFDISNYYSVVRMKNAIMISMNLPMNHSSYMPVTRDLSRRKRRMIVDWLSAEKPKIGKVDKLMNLQHLRSLLQTALEVEHATIPPYLTALWSLRDNYNRQIYRIIKTVVNQEMLHMGLVANVINAVGGHPSFIHSKFMLNYPSKLPGGVRPDLIVSLEMFSRNVAKNVFMKIEEPDMNEEHIKLRRAIFEHLELLRCEVGASQRPQGINKCLKRGNTTSMDGIRNRGCPKIVNDYLKNLSEKSSGDFKVNNDDEMGMKRELLEYKTNIAALYTHVLVVIARLTNCGANESIFTGKQELQLATDKYRYGNGRLIEVNDYVSAVTAIKMVIEEGEGTSDCDPKVRYADNANEDISHYTLFETITKGHRIELQKREMRTRKMEQNSSKHECQAKYEYSGKVVRYFPEGVWPIKKNVRQSEYKVGTLTEIRSKIFTVMYNRLLATLHKTFNGEKQYFTNSLFLMYAIDYYGRELVKFSIDEHGSPYVGPNAAPVFKWMAVDPDSVKSSNITFVEWHKSHLKSLGKANKEKRKKQKLARHGRKQSRSKTSRTRKGHKKFSYDKHVNRGILKEAVESMIRTAEEADELVNHRRLQREFFSSEREAEKWDDNEDDERQRLNDYRNFEYGNDNRNYQKILDDRRRFYNDIKDQMDTDRIIEDLWQSRRMEKMYIDKDEDDDDYDYDDGSDVSEYDNTG